MSMHHTRKPSAASESFITALAVLFFISLAFLFQYLDRNKSSAMENPNDKASSVQTEIPEHTAYYDPQKFPNLSTDKISGNANTDNLNDDMLRQEFLAAGIHPPFPSLDISPMTKTVDAGSGLLFQSKHQSVITIPPYAFLDKDGNIVKGNVEVSYREFFNYMDIFLSGIPMHFNSSQLESAGMFEFTASKNNEPVYANPENKISVMLASLKETPGYNMYYYDMKQKRWIEKGESKVSRTTASNAFISNQTMVVDSVQTVFNFDKAEYSIRLSGTREPAKKKKSFFSKQQPSDGFSFQFVASDNTVPELNALRTIRWKYKGKDAMEKFNDVFYSDDPDSKYSSATRSWKDIALVHQTDDDTYLLTLADKNDTVSLKVYPRLTSEKSIRKFQELMDVFTPTQDKRIVYEKVGFQKFQEDTAAYFASNPRYEKKYMTASYMAMRQFQLDGFGVWNCDRPISMPQSTTVLASFTDMNGKKVNPITVYLADKSINTLFTYYAADFQNFKFNPNADNLVWALFPGNVIAVIKPSEFQQKYAKSKTTCMFKMNLNRNAVLTKEKLKEQLAFDL
jgi:hypothetical protein